MREPIISDVRRERVDGHTAAQLALDLANRVHAAGGQSWGELAIEALRQFLAITPTGFLAEEVRDFAHARGLPKPPDGRSWGGVILVAARRGLIRKTGAYRPQRSAGCHAAPKPVWIRCEHEVVRLGERVFEVTPGAGITVAGGAR